MTICKCVLVAAASAVFAWGQSSEKETSLKGSTAVEVYGGTTFNLTGARAFVQAGSQVADSGPQTVLGVVGGRFQYMFTNLLGAYFDTSYVDAGSAFASIGSYREDVKGNLFDYQGGILLQYPGKTWRPYLNFGGGGSRQSIDFTTTIGSSASTSQVRANVGEFVYGGGIRWKFSNHWGVRVAAEGVSMSAPSGGSKQNYARFLSGVFWESK